MAGSVVDQRPKCRVCGRSLGPYCARPWQLRCHRCGALCESSGKFTLTEATKRWLAKRPAMAALFSDTSGYTIALAQAEAAARAAAIDYTKIAEVGNIEGTR